MAQSAKRVGHHEAVLVVFAKAPVPGQVKTRLCPPLTHDEAATLHGSFVLDTLERTKLAREQLRLPFDRYLACAPSSSLPFFKIMEERHGVPLIEQSGDTLGARMHRGFSEMFDRGYRNVMIVGTDVPSLPLEHYAHALRLLTDHDLVLGPAVDGGYYLIGLTAPSPWLFEDIPWSTDRVLSLTRERAHQRGISTALLAPWRDVDTIDDLRALIESCALDNARPKSQRIFSSRTAGALELLAKRLRSRA
ncbi:hypothetical protein W02_18290 [Nitrospira sp. KM1]|uniref:TIGR04282 family arsenosugar biosynthesis glycosyltransferase n=1 Tax=Nitrospira sp. KM1 TaxID=1936990 RepID=UPI0013A7223C|nr:TIGR04282 family arsenosugar biosynthesis glycosyltransferase [Nitrospira sp. KM1]BCA54689.1 hypothetical protein W02_18290 [Nitrospira sp. KM1]